MKELSKRVPTAVQRHPLAADAALALAFLVAGLVSVASIFNEISTFDPEFDPPATVWIVLSMLGISFPLALRRRFPLSTLVVVAAAFLVGRVAVENPESAITFLTASLAIYSAAVHGRKPFRTPLLALGLAAYVGEVVRELFFLGPDGPEPLVQGFVLFYNAIVLALPWVLGAVIRSLRERRQELDDRATELQREREENARQAVFAERVRIARELHDVVAHHVSVMGVQAGAARRVMERQPEKAADALTSIEASSRQAVVELQRLLGFLRRAGEDDELAPQPGLAQLGDLVAEATSGDLTVDLLIEGEPRPLSPTLDVSAYRVIQEALTNTRKHSGGTTASVRVRYGAAVLEIDVLDDGTSHHEPLVGDEGGHGLIGMRERANLHGGHIGAGPRPGGGFAVHATFPLNGSPE